MKTIHLLIFFLSFVAFVNISCEDDEEQFYMYEMSEVYDPDIPVHSVYVPINKGASVGIAGGKAPYSVFVSDTQLASLTLEDGNIVNISPLRLGVSTLVAEDSEGKRTQIELRVTEGMEIFRVSEVYVDVQGSMEQAEQSEIESFVLSQADMEEGSEMTFSYLYEDSGDLLISSPKGEESEDVSGSFTIEKASSRPHVEAFYNTASHVFYITSSSLYPDYESVGVRDLGPSSLWLVEDVTEKCKAQYPEVDSVRLIYVGLWIRF